MTQIVNGRFHHFHLARQLESRNLLDHIYTSYPQFKLKDEQGIAREKIRSFPLFQASYLWARRFGLSKYKALDQSCALFAKKRLDGHVAARINKPTVLVALSSSGLKSGERAKSLGGRYICDRGSSHIRYQNEILTAEYARWGLVFRGVDPRMMEREEAEYQAADYVTVPSEFCVGSFLAKGYPAEKIVKIPYGARLERFQKCADPDPTKFTVLWVGGVSIRKAFLDALHAFQRFNHPGKRFRVIGSVEPAVRELFAKEDLTGVEFLGTVPNQSLAEYYSTADAFVLSSVEEGLAMVQGEALACGCPVITSENSGGSDLITDGVEGFIVPIHSPESIADRLQQLADDRDLWGSMSDRARTKVKSLGGWDDYGNNWAKLIEFKNGLE